MTIAEKNKKVAAVLAAGSVALAGVGAMAFFTDWEQGDFDGLKGVQVADNPIEIIPNDYDDNKVSDESISTKWAAAMPENFNPGDAADLEVKLSNIGSVDADLRETIVITSDEPFTGSDLANIEYRIRTGIITTAHDADNGAFHATDGAVIANDDAITAVDVKEEIVGNNQVKYTLIYDKLAAGASVIRDYNLIFDGDAPNAFQGDKVKVEYLVEAKQTNDANGNDGDASEGWTQAATGTFEIGGDAANKATPVKYVAP